MDAGWNTANPICERSGDFFKAKIFLKPQPAKVRFRALTRGSGTDLRECRGLERSSGDIKNGEPADAIRDVKGDRRALFISIFFAKALADYC